jgi:UDP-hydrolysing UDP-N-acetyl-D-glucosamine 2-epimerase
MKVCAVIGSRADEGLLAWPIQTLQADDLFCVTVLNLKQLIVEEALRVSMQAFADDRPDYVLLLGDRFEILATAFAAHLHRIPIAHIAGGDVTEGSYDDAMRDCISRLATLHFSTSMPSHQRLLAMGYANAHLVGNPGLDYILHGDWKKPRPYAGRYVVVSYQPETQDGTNEIEALLASLPDWRPIFLLPNPDRGSDAIEQRVLDYCAAHPGANAYRELPHDDFLNLLVHCDEFIGNSSAIFYEAPALGVKTRLIGKRQNGRVVPWGDGHASERIVKILKEQMPCLVS